MSFVKKGLKKAWGFVKKHWLEIALVAAVVFTAGIATVGFGAFAAAGFGSASAVTAAGGVVGAGTFGSFMGAVGTTMWAGVAGTAGTLGIGPGATAIPGSAAATAGASHVGLGAAWGANSGFGLGVAGKTAAAEAAAAEAAKATSAEVYGAAYDATIAESAGYDAAATTAQKEAAREAAMKAATEAAKKEAISGAAKKTAIDMAAKEGGMTTAQATLISTGVAAAGPALMALGDKTGSENADIWGSNSGTGMPGRSALQVAGADTPSTPGAGVDPGVGGANAAAEGLMQQQKLRADRSNYADIYEDEEDGYGLMGNGRYGYAT